MLGFLNGNNIALGLILLAVFGAISAGLYFKGVQDGIKKQAAIQASAEREAVAQGREIEQVIMTLPKNEVQSRLEKKWCRDCL